MKNVMTALTAFVMLMGVAIAALLIVFPQQWKQDIYPSVASILPESINALMPGWG